MFPQHFKHVLSSPPKSILPSIILIILCLTAVRAQFEEIIDPELEKKGPQVKINNVRDLQNTTSCVEPPFECPHPRIQFFLYTRFTQTRPDILDTTNDLSLYESHFNPAHPVKVIIHGFQGGRKYSPNTDIRRAYFARGNYNIIVVDYSTLVLIPCLSQIEWSPRFCAMCIAQMAQYLAAHPRGVSPERLHLIGYSIGAHIGGLTANFIPEGKLGRITGKTASAGQTFLVQHHGSLDQSGLDPTIIFYMGNNRSRDLDPSDAIFVDIIHTGAGVLGQWGPNGHADFYVNGGTSQPGCGSDTLIKQLSCDHTLVTPYFVESINSDRGFWALPCPNRFLFNLGLCEAAVTEYVPMGEHVPWRARGVYYLTTNAKKPYAKGMPDGKKPPFRALPPPQA